ncbi:MAG: response regulator [Clostridiales bacterium]
MCSSSILIVDDEPEVRNNLAELLDNFGYKSIQATDGSDAFSYLENSILKNSLPDLIISDIMMPRMNGFKLLETVQENPILQNIPFILLTAKNDDVSFRGGMNHGADDFITKPYDASELLKAIEVRLNKSKRASVAVDEVVNNILMYVPHELRTPLSSISGFSQLITESYYFLSADEIYDMVSKIDQSNKRLHRTVEKFIALSEIICIQSDVNRKNELKDRYLNETEFVIRGSALAKADEYGRTDDIKYHLTSSGALITEEFLHLMVMELTENAMKFSQSGTPVEISSRTEDDLFILSIKDYGKGMSIEEIAKISAFIQFGRKFHQQEGNGLGLTIVQKAADLFSGSVMIVSERNKYTHVTVTLRLTPTY